MTIETEDVTASVAIHAPRGRVASVARDLLENVGISIRIAPSLGALAQLVQQRIAAVVITEESLAGAGSDAFIAAVRAQPSWSGIPFIVLANGSASVRSDHATQRLDALRNVFLLARPLHAEELIRSVRSALTARARQHEARKTMEALQLRERELSESNAKFHAIANSVDHMIWTTLPDGYHDYYNQRWYEFTGVPEGSTDGEAWNGMFHPGDQERAWDVWRHSLKTGELYEVEYRLRHRSGEYRWVLGRAHPLRDATGKIQRWYGSCTDIHEIKVAQEQRHLMLAEMNHRVKNTLAMVNVMVSQTLRQAEDLQDARTAIQSRIGMMARAHDQLIQTNWTQTRIVEVVDAALAPHRTGEGRFTIEGPDIPIGSKQALALTMALHELATNAGKYGALSNDRGKVRIRWTAEELDDNGKFVFQWTESDGPEVQAPARRGFGSRMIEQALAGYFEGTGELSYDPDGLSFSLRSKLAGVTS